MLSAVWGCDLARDNKKLIIDNHLAAGRQRLYLPFPWTIEFAVYGKGFSISPPSAAQVHMSHTLFWLFAEKQHFYKGDVWVIDKRDGTVFV